MCCVCRQVSPEGPKTLVGATEIYKHKPLDADEIKKLEKENSCSEETGGSAWNKGGTWEEKDFSKWAEGRVKEVCYTTTATLVLLYLATTGAGRI